MLKLMIITFMSVGILSATDFVPNELIIAVDNSSDATVIFADIDKFLDHRYEPDEFSEGLYLIRLNAETMDQVIKLLSSRKEVKYTQPNFIKKTLR